MFVGAERQQFVNDLRDDFNDVASNEGPRMVVLSAPSGEGKTRIVQEFYRALAAEQSLPHYWPPVLTNDDVDWKSVRKCLAVPEFTPGPDATIPWIYWSISCQRRQDGSLAQALFNDITQFNAHAEPLFSRLSARDVAGRSFDGANALIGLLGGLGLIIIPPVGAVISGVGIARTIVHNRDLVARFNKWHERRDEKKGGGLSLDGKNFGRQEYVEDLVLNTEKVSLEIPVVIAVDDIHWGDETLIAFLDGLLGNPRARVFVVATTWPNEMDASRDDTENSPFSEWCAEVLAQPLSRHLEIRDVTPMAMADRQSLVQCTYDEVAIEGDPRVGDDVATALSERFSTPMGIRAFFDLGSVKSLIHHGGLTTQDLNRLPRNLSQVMVAYWDELPAELQAVLAVAAISGERFATTPVLDAASTLGLADPGRQLDRGKNPYKVIRSLGESLDAFSDLMLHQVAATHAEDAFSTHELKVIYDSIASYALALDPTATGATLLSAVWSTHVALAQSDQWDLVNRNAAAESARNLAKFSAGTYNFRVALSYGQVALSWMAGPSDAFQALELRGEIASWLGKSGQLAEAIAALQELLPDQVSVVGPDHRDTLMVRYNLANWLGESGQVTEAIADFRPLISDEKRVLGSDDSNTLSAREALAYFLGQSGQVAEAVVACEGLIEDHLRVHGSDHPDTLTARETLALWLGASGRVAEAQAVDELLLVDQLRIRGPEHPDTFRTRNNLACWLGQMGREHESVSTLEALLSVQSRVMGPDHPDTILVRMNLAVGRGKCGQLSEALIEIDALIEVELRVLGPDHPYTLATRDRRVRLLGECGHFDSSITEGEVLIQDELRVFGSDHPILLRSRSCLASNISMSGNVSAAVTAFEELLADELRVLGPRHLFTLETRSQYALSLERNGQAIEARAALQELLSDQEHALGSEHPDTLSTRRELARMSIDIGD